MLKKVLSVILSLSMFPICSFAVDAENEKNSVIASSAPFTDISGHWAEEEIKYMYNAIEKAAELAELTSGDYSVRTYRKSYYDRLMESFKSSISSVSFIKNICERKAWEELYLPQNMIRAEME